MPGRVGRRGVLGGPVTRTAAVVGTAAVAKHGHDRREDRRDDRGDRGEDRRDDREDRRGPRARDFPIAEFLPRRFTRGDSYSAPLEAGPTSRKDGFEGQPQRQRRVGSPNQESKRERVRAMSESTVDRTTLPIRRPPFGGTTMKTLDGSVADWSQAAHVSAPDGAPNVLLVLIDDAGFGNPSTFGGPIQTPNYSRLAENGLRYNRFHVTALCSPTRAALLTGRNHHRVGFGMVGEFSGPFPGYNATVPHDCALFPRVLQENGYLTGGFGKWHLTPDNQQGFSGPFRPLADPARLRLLLGVPRRGGRSVRPADRREPEDGRRTRGEGRRAVLLPGRPRRQDDRLDPQGSLREAEDTVVRLRCNGVQPCAAPRAGRVVGQVPGCVRPGLGRDARGDVRAAEGTRGRTRGRGAPAAQRCDPRHGTRSTRRTSACMPARWRCTLATPRTPTGTSVASSTRSTRSASSRTPS